MILLQRSREEKLRVLVTKLPGSCQVQKGLRYLKTQNTSRHSHLLLPPYMRVRPLLLITEEDSSNQIPGQLATTLRAIGNQDYSLEV